MKTSPAAPRRNFIRAFLCAGILATALAAHAHHGNPDAPAPTWEGSLPPGTPVPHPPAQPGG